MSEISPHISDSSWPLAWTALFLVATLLEGIALGRPETGDSLTELLRNYIRFDPVGRFVLLSLWVWLTWHWILRPRYFPMLSKYDALAMLAGFGWAIIESRR